VLAEEIREAAVGKGVGGPAAAAVGKGRTGALEEAAGPIEPRRRACAMLALPVRSQVFQQRPSQWVHIDLSKQFREIAFGSASASHHVLCCNVDHTLSFFGVA